TSALLAPAELRAGRRERLHGLHAEKRDVARAGGAQGPGLQLDVPAVFDFGLRVRLHRYRPAAGRHGLALDAHALADAFGEVILGDQRISRRIHAAGLANVGQHVIAIVAALQTADDRDVLAAFHLDFGLRRRFGFLRLRADCAGAYDREPDRDRRHTFHVHGKVPQRGVGPANGNVRLSRSSALSRLPAAALRRSEP